MPLLKTIYSQNLSLKKNLVFVNITIGLPLLNLHIHFYDQSSYTRTNQELGLAFMREVSLNNVINKIECDTNYFRDINIPFYIFFYYF